jgi:hypothetical protein
VAEIYLTGIKKDAERHKQFESSMQAQTAEITKLNEKYSYLLKEKSIEQNRIEELEKNNEVMRDVFQKILKRPLMARAVADMVKENKGQLKSRK